MDGLPTSMIATRGLTKTRHRLLCLVDKYPETETIEKRTLPVFHELPTFLREYAQGVLSIPVIHRRALKVSLRKTETVTGTDERSIGDTTTRKPSPSTTERYVIADRFVLTEASEGLLPSYAVRQDNTGQ